MQIKFLFFSNYLLLKDFTQHFQRKYTFLWESQKEYFSFKKKIVKSDSQWATI